jgi:hypothetical protein
MTAQERIEAANKALRNYCKHPTAKAPAVANKKVDTESLKARIAEVRKNVEAAYNKAHELKAWKQTAQLHPLINTLTELEVTLKKISKACAHSYPTAPGF